MHQQVDIGINVQDRSDQGQPDDHLLERRTELGVVIRD